ncbi:hypothetical protein HCN44_009168 [Aphidius gifuensis]|uniref:Uncharacterized protein n=1 Tax=Aphidius gifuensis TaxID=684658 RepID=A0A834Y1T1_APHGI|nr:hypothetical protein HCN44_009168 [Aphidius gifuensis]
MMITTALGNSLLPQVSYLVMQTDRSCIRSMSNSTIQDITVEGKWPSFINYTVKIEKDTDIQIQVTFEDNYGIFHEDYENILNSSICEVLDRAIDDPTSADARFLIPEAIGLYGTRCPIQRVIINSFYLGLRSIAPYRFPTLINMSSMGEGKRRMKITLFQNNQKTNIKQNILTIFVLMEVRYWPLKNTLNQFFTITIPETPKSNSPNNITIELVTLFFVTIGSFLIS